MKQYPYTLTPEIVDCKLCTEYERKTGCKDDTCLCMEERIEAGAVSYKEVLTSISPQPPGLSWRIHDLARRYERFWEPSHEQRMAGCIAALRLLPEPEYYPTYAALYLLTSNEELSRRTANCILADSIGFQFAVSKGMPGNLLTRFIVAFLLYNGRAEQVIYDQCCDAEMRDTDLSLILNAILIFHYGPGVFHLKGELEQ